MKLLPKIVVAVVVPVLLGAGAVLYVLTGSWQRTLEAELVESARRALIARVDTAPAGLLAARDTLRLLAVSPVLAGGDEMAIRSTLRQWNLRSDLFEGFYFSNLDGLTYPADGDRFDVSDREHFQLLPRGEEVLARPLISRFTQRPVLLIRVPVKDSGGQLLGSLGGTILLKPFLERTVADANLRSASFVLLDQAGMLLAGGVNGEAVPLEKPDAVRAPWTAAVADAVKHTMVGEETQSALRVTVQGEVLRVLHAPVPLVSWRLVYVQPESEMLAPLAEARRLAFMVILVATLAAMLLAAFLHRLIVRPVQQLTETHRRLQRGERGARATVSGSDEFADLAASFNRLADTLQQSESRFRSIFEDAPYPVTLNRVSDAVYLDVNSAFERASGLRREDVLGKTPEALGLLDTNSEEMQAQRAQLLATGGLDNKEIYGVDLHGQAHWTLYSSRLTEIDGEQVAISMTADITRLKMTDAALRESEASFSALFDLAPIPLAYCDEATAYRFTHWNKAWYDCFGYSFEEADGKNGTDFGLWTDLADRQAYLDTVINTGRVAGQSVQMRCRDGSIRQIELFGRFIGAGGMRRLVTAYLDVTEKLLAESTLRAREMWLRSLFDVSPVAVLVVDLRGNIRECNRRFVEMLGRPMAEVVGHSYFDFIYPTQVAAAQKGVGQMLLDHSVDVFSAERTYVRSDGSALPGLLSARRLPGSGGGEDVLLIIINDLSDLRMAEAQRLESETKLQDLNITLTQQFALSDAVVRAQANFIANAQATGAFESLLTDLLQLAESEYGFIGEIVHDEEGAPYLKTHAITNIAWDDSSRRYYEENAPTGLEFRNLKSLFGAAMLTGEPVIANMPGTDSRRGGLPPGHPAMNAFLGLPIKVAGQLVAMAGVANRPGGYDQRLVEWLQPMLGTIGQMVEARRAALAQQAAERALRELNDALDERVKERTQTLNQTNEELTAALEAVRRAQGELVRSEKLAALGSLVAGVAHELNTPIGNSVTVASTLVENSEIFAEEMKGALKRSVLLAYVENSRRAAELLLGNLQRAATLVASFKQVAVDQTSEQRRHFYVAEVVDEILAMLQPQLKKRPLEVRKEIEHGLVLDSYPGPFGQVVANLVNNAAIHAFDDGRVKGVIMIEARAHPEGVQLSISDDGVGIPPDHIDRIFDPFFTTRFGQGGSGLGLNIVYNIVSGVLGGKIRVESRPGEGSSFFVLLPTVAPARKDEYP